MTPLDAAGRARLRAALRARYPWLTATEFGPATVDAGECDRCGDEPRLVATCGPVAWRSLGRRCAVEVGPEAWCDGHQADAARALRWLAALPAEADDVVRLWWVATGEVRADAWPTRARLRAAGLVALEADGGFEGEAGGDAPHHPHR